MSAAACAKIIANGAALEATRTYRDKVATFEKLMAQGILTDDELRQAAKIDKHVRRTSVRACDEYQDLLDRIESRLGELS